MSAIPATAEAQAEVWFGAAKPAGKSGLLDRLPWMRRGEETSPAVEAAADESLAPASPISGVDPALIQDARNGWNDGLWGAGYRLPGGEAEIGRLTKPLPLSPANTLLLVGRDAGGAASSIARERGAWIASHQHDPGIGRRVTSLVAPLGRKVAVQEWEPANPKFRPGFHTHALALEPMRVLPAVDLEALFAAVSDGLKAAGQIVLLEVVAGPEAARHALTLQRWMALEERGAAPPPAEAIEASLRGAGFVPHVQEDVAPRHLNAMIDGWARLVETLPNDRPFGTVAAALVEEAETWLLRHRLLSAGAIGLRRWHASRA